MRSSLEIYDLASGRTRTILQTGRLIEAPNWDPDGRTLLINGDGRLFRADIATGAETPVDTGDCIHCNNDHGISPDGATIAISENLPGTGSVIHTLSATGGAPRRISDEPVAYWHGWSPDGQTLAFCGKRGGRFDIWTIPAAGGPETRVTGLDGAEDGHNDGPDYSPDGKWIWFNSDRTGHAQIWKARPDGSAPTRMTGDTFVNWFPHPSPDGNLVLYLAFPSGTEGHPRDRDVGLRLMAPDGTGMREVLRFNGGQGTINVPCWAPNSRAFAFVRYAPE